MCFGQGCRRRFETEEGQDKKEQEEKEQREKEQEEKEEEKLTSMSTTGAPELPSEVRDIREDLAGIQKQPLDRRAQHSGTTPEQTPCNRHSMVKQ